jgi:myo-inositol oxygenase
VVSVRAVNSSAALRLGRGVNHLLHLQGLDLQRWPPGAHQPSFGRTAVEIVERHRAQSAGDIAVLQRRYTAPVFGQCRVWDLIERLGCCVDPSDQRLYLASQQMHVLQMISRMEEDGAATPEMILAALIHDLGKLLLLTGEDPANVTSMNAPVGQWAAGSGLDNCLLQWNHDEFAYQRFKDLISPDLAWLVRYHSVQLPQVIPLMDDTDLERYERLLRPFVRYDQGTKSPVRMPTVSLLAYRDLIEDAFPDPINF